MRADANWVCERSSSNISWPYAVVTRPPETLLFSNGIPKATIAIISARAVRRSGSGLAVPSSRAATSRRACSFIVEKSQDRRWQVSTSRSIVCRPGSGGNACPGEGSEGCREKMVAVLLYCGGAIQGAGSPRSPSGPSKLRMEGRIAGDRDCRSDAGPDGAVKEVPGPEAPSSCLVELGRACKTEGLALPCKVLADTLLSSNNLGLFCAGVSMDRSSEIGCAEPLEDGRKVDGANGSPERDCMLFRNDDGDAGESPLSRNLPCKYETCARSCSFSSSSCCSMSPSCAGSRTLGPDGREELLLAESAGTLPRKSFARSDVSYSHGGGAESEGSEASRVG